MDLAFYLLTSLTGAGYSLNSKKQPREQKFKVEQHNKADPNGTNIYNSKDFYKAEAEEARRVIKNWEASKDPITTGVIPMYYNTLYLRHDDVEKVKNPNFNDKTIYKVLDSFDEKTRKLINAKTQALKPSRVSRHLNDNGRMGKSEWGIVSGRPSSSKMTATEGKLDQIGGSLLPNRGYEDFTHGNMVPFYSGRLKQNMDVDNRMAAGKLETYTGQFKLNQDQKREVGPFFSPTYGVANIHGNVEKRDLSRYIPSNTGKKHSELPFEQVLVGPGLNKGFTAKPSGGFNQGLVTRIMPKSTEELRVDPVFEQEGRINHGKSVNQSRTAIQQLYKNRPALLVENKKGERNFTTVGAVRGRRIRPGIILRDTNRKKSKVLINHAKMANNHKAYVPSKARVSRKANFFNTPHRNAVLATGKKINDFGKGGYRNRLNERALTGTRAHLMNPKTWVNAVTAYFTDAAKKTRKQYYINHARSNGNANPQRPSALPAYDPLHVARTTIRETTEDFNRLGNVNSSQKKTRSYDPKAWSAKTTIRETTENKKHKGWIKQLGGGKGPSYNTGKDAQARTTVRETTENNKYLGITGSNWKKHQSYDPMAWSAKTTVKETTENNKHLGVVGSIQKKHVAYDPNDRTKTTIKETTEDSKHIGIVGSIRKKHVAYDPNDRAKTTIKETTEDSKHIGNVGRAALQSGKGYQTTNWYANNTNRQFTSDNQYTGVANSKSKKTRSYDAAYNAELNVEKEKVAKGRNPTQQRFKVSNGPSHVNIQVNKIDGDRSNWRSSIKTSNVGMYYNPQAITYCTNTSEKNHLPQHDTRLDPALLDAYKSNPLTQSLSSYF